MSAAEIYDPSTNSWTTAGEMETPRRKHTASLMPDGSVIIVGGADAEDFPVETAEVFDPATERFSPAGDMNLARQFHSATRLADGRVMIVGGGGDDGVLRWVEMYDSARGRWLVQGSTGSWAKAPDLNRSRTSHSATLLDDGQVLVAGGRTKITDEGEDARAGETEFLDSAELFDPAGGRWSQAGSMSHERGDHFAVRLADGRVLVSGGQFLGPPNDDGKRSIEVLPSTEIYDPAAGSWSQAADMTSPRQRHSGVLLADGRVFVAGGDSGGALASTEIYDPASDTWEAAPPMANERSFPVAFSLQDGRVLLMGGAGGSAEIFDPASGAWTTTGSLSTRVTQAATAILADGRVLVASGFGPQGGLNTVEVYDPASGAWTMAQQLRRKRIGPTATPLPSGLTLLVGGRTSSTLLFDAAALNWSPAGKLAAGRRGHTATLLADGTVLIAGGEGRNSAVLATSEIYTP